MTLVEALSIIIPSILATVIPLYFGKRMERAKAVKQEADYADQISETAMKLISPLEQRISYLEKVEKTYRRYSAYLLEGIRTLTHQLADAKITPCWSPEDIELPDRPTMDIKTIPVHKDDAN